MVRKTSLDEIMDDLDAKAPPIPAPPVAYYDFVLQNAMYAPGGGPHAWMPEGPSMTRQEFAAECDINVLMQRYENQDIGAIMRRAGEPAYYDFSELPSDLMGFMKLTQDAENAFMTLSAQVRRQFDNDPVDFVNFASDPANLEQMRTWGLAPPAPSVPSAAAPADVKEPAAGTPVPAAPTQSSP